MRDKDLHGRILIDTNILIYATLGNDTRFKRATEVMELRSRQDIDMHVSVQNLAEMYPNLTGPKNQPPDPPEVARAKIQSIARLTHLTLVPITMETINRALRLCDHYRITRQRYFDMQLVALMLDEGIPTLLTENISDFQDIPEIQAVNPFA